MRAAAGRLGGTGLVEACAQLEESARSGRSGPDGADPRGAEREYRSLRALLAQYHPLDGTIRG
jgi:hypothetical protein